jgi:hypothetical protein
MSEAHSRSEYKATLKGEPNLLAENARLKAENRRLREALERITLDYCGGNGTCPGCIARAALAEEK